MSEKLSEQLCMIAGALETTNPLRGRRIAHIAKKVAALEQQLAAEQAAHDQIATICFREGDELREEVPIIHGRAELVAHDAALRASVREECANAAMEAFGHNETNLPHSDGCIACAVKQAILAAPEESK